MNKYQIVSNILSESSTYFKVGKSKIHGKGILATSNIPSNTNLGIAFTKVKNTGKPDLDYERTPLGVYVNHSKQPNVKLDIKGKKFYYITIKPVKKNEELFLNYATFPWEGERSFVGEGVILSGKPITINFELWKKKQAQILYITGPSGSGKTTYSKELAKEYKSKYIQLDHFYRDFFAKSHGDDWWKKGLGWKEVLKCLDALKQDIEKIRAGDQQCIIDGIGVLDIIHRRDKTWFFKDEAIILLQESSLKSAYRAAKRDKELDSLESMIWHMRDRLKANMTFQKEIKRQLPYLLKYKKTD